MENIFRLLSTLGLTIAIEYPIVQVLWLALKEDNQKNTSKIVFWKNRIIIIPTLIVNILTNPAINIFAQFLLRNTSVSENEFWSIITILEFIIWAIEAVLYKYMLKTSWKNAFAMAVLANFVSYMSSFLL